MACLNIEIIRALLHQQIALYKTRAEPIDHILFYGPNGLGQQRLADMVITDMGVEQETYLALPDHQPNDLLSRIVQVPDGGILLIDNLHRVGGLLVPILEVVMSEAMRYDESDPAQNRSAVGLRLPRFSVIGTTTNLKRVPPTIQEQFGVQFRVDF
jgi:Holliday junction DNA helicase RuvB